MFTKEELSVINEALKIADAKYMKEIEDGNRNLAVSANRKQKKLWLVQNKLKKIMSDNK